jgi:hypothetical protein
MATKLKHQTGNPESVSKIDQGRGPTAGNEGNAEKRKAFVADKSAGSKTEVSRMIMSAFAKRGEDMKPYIDPGVEGISATTNQGRGPTRGNGGKTGKSQRLNSYESKY